MPSEMGVISNLAYAYYLYTASGDTVLSFDSQPSDKEQMFESSLSRLDYRSGIMSGTKLDGSSLLTCVAKRAGSSTSPEPIVQWTRNGERVMNATGLMTSLTINNFSESDVGNYQCIYSLSDNDTEILTSIPYRLQTGELCLLNTSRDMYQECIHFCVYTLAYTYS